VRPMPLKAFWLKEKQVGGQSFDHRRWGGKRFIFKSSNEPHRETTDTLLRLMPKWPEKGKKGGDGVAKKTEGAHVHRRKSTSGTARWDWTVKVWKIQWQVSKKEKNGGGTERNNTRRAAENYVSMGRQAKGSIPYGRKGGPY